MQRAMRGSSRHPRVVFYAAPASTGEPCLRASLVERSEADPSLDNLTYSVRSSHPSGSEKVQPYESSSLSTTAFGRRMTFRSEGQLNGRPPTPVPPEKAESIKQQSSYRTGAPVLGLLTKQPNQRRHSAGTVFNREQLATQGAFGDYVDGAFTYLGNYKPAAVYSVDSQSTSTGTSTSTSTSASSSGSRRSLCAPTVRDDATLLPAAPPKRPAATDAVAGRLQSLKRGPRLPLIAGIAALVTLLIFSAVATSATLTRTATNDGKISDVLAGPPITEPLSSGVPVIKSAAEDHLGPKEDDESPMLALWGKPDSDVAEVANNGDVRRTAPAVGGGTVHKENESGFISSQESMQRPYRRQPQAECGAVFYTYCRVPREEYHYRASLNACVSSSESGDALRLCNRGPNRFASWRSCERSCVLSEPPLEACLDKTLFIGCRRQDVQKDWWWFDGRTCLAWNFPGGGCPANESSVFTSAELCTRRCTNPRYPPCASPKVAPCHSTQLKFPFFAAESPLIGKDGTGRRCLAMSTRVLTMHRCLTGANRFSSKAVCEATCKSPPE